ncbi:MAG: hypothetical protein V1913_01495 [Fibrobacterota bacterium]
MNIKPIKTEADYKSALAAIRKLWDVEPNTPEGDKLEILITLVEAYEAKHYPMAPPNPVDAIKFRMEQDGLRSVDIARIIGGKNRVSEMLSGKKPLTLKMIKNLHNKLGMPYESLFGPQDFIYRTHAFRIILDTVAKSGPCRKTVDKSMEVAQCT